jgi:death-on-curing family protein
MNDIFYPTQKVLELWVKLLRDENSSLELSLPNIDEEWYQKMMDVVTRAKNSYYPAELHLRAAELFYNTNKAHNFLDGNKRSSILIVYLFYVINDRYITSHLDIRKMAKSLAKSHGRSQHDRWIEKLRKCFEDSTTQLTRMD